MSEEQTKRPPLGGGWKDSGVALMKGGLGAIPVAGSIIAEVIGLIIPNQRMERIEDYLRYLSDRLYNLDQQSLKEKFSDPENTDLFEEGAAQSLRAISQERKIYITTLVADGIKGEAKERIEAKRLLKLLQDIDDDQVIILTSYLNRYRHNTECRENNSNVLTPIRAYIGASQEDLDRNTVYELARAQLLGLGLIRQQYKSFRKGEMPKFDDKTGMIKSSSRDLTPLGRLLLSRIGISGAEEF